MLPTLISKQLLAYYVFQAIIISCCGCFHGRTMAAISMSCDSEATRDFGPAVGGHAKVDFGDANALAILLKGQCCWLCAAHYLPLRILFC